MSAPAHEFVSRPSYDPAHFADRKAAVDNVLSAVERLVNPLPQSPGDPIPAGATVIIYDANRGLGKTWLLKHLEFKVPDVYPPESGKCAVAYIDLQRQDGEDEDACILRCVSSLSQMLKSDVGSESMEELLSGLNPDKVVVALLDHAWESPLGVRHAVEDAALSMLVKRRNAVIVMAGRGTEANWDSMELKVDPVSLLPFEPEYVDEQMMKMASLLPPGVSVPDATSLHLVTGGLPWANYLEAWRRAGQPIDIPSIIIGDSSLVAPLTAVCVLRWFEDKFIPPLLSAHPEAAASPLLGGNEPWQIVIVLKKSGFIFWSNIYNDYVMDSGVRAFLEDWLRQNQRALWLKLHSEAARILAAELALMPADDRPDHWVAAYDYHNSIIDQNREVRAP